MGIHYDYKSTRGEKALKKRLKKKHVLSKEEQERLKITLYQKKKTKCMI